jgi:Carbohydrate-selective porin, OprB family
MTRSFNWLSITTFCLLATLMPIAGAQATESTSATTDSINLTVSQSNPNQLIALTKKKRKRIVRKKVRIRTQAKPQTTSAEPTTSPADVTQSPPTPTPVTPPPAPAEPSVTREEVEALLRSNQQLREELIKVDGRATEAAKKVEQLDRQQFSINTKLQGSVIFGITGTVAGDYSRNTAFGQRTRLELKTEIGAGTLTTRLQAVGLGLANQNPTTTTTPATNEGSLSWTDGTTDSRIGIDTLKYEFPLTPQTQLVIAGNAGAADDFTDTINPYFDGDGASGSISTFGNRPSIYYTVQGQGVGIRHKLSDTTELSVGYLARKGNDPASGSGLFGGGYGALAQLSFKTGENSKVGLTYTRSFNPDRDTAVPGTGSNNANLVGASDNFGVAGSFQLSPQFVLGGWAGYTQNKPFEGGDFQVWTWAVTAAAPDLGGKGNLAGLLIGQEPRVTAASNGAVDPKSGLHIEGFYQFKLSDSLSITPGIIYLTAPDQGNNSSTVIGAVRTTFSF